MDHEVRDIPDLGTWLGWRRNHITASRMGALFDCHPYLSREQLSGDLQGASVKGDTPAMRRGRIFEPSVAAALQEEHPEWVISKSGQYYCVPSARLGATPDYLAETPEGPIVIECKTASPYRWDEWHGKMPLHYILQLLTCLMVTDRPRGVLACMVMGGSYPVHEYEVQRHPAAEQRIIDAVAEWWKQYDAGLIAAPAPVEELEAMLDDGSHRDLSGNTEIGALLEERRVLKAYMKGRLERLGEIEYTIKNTLGPASSAWIEGWSISFKQYHRAEYTVPAKDVRTLRIREITSE
jgi:predicted phage-related endonuclease